MNVLCGPETIDHTTQTATVDVARCRDVWLSFSYAGDGWNPYSSIIYEYMQNPKLTYEESTYKTFLERCHLRQPRSWYSGPIRKGCLRWIVDGRRFRGFREGDRWI
jgi:hypothetical protein